MERARAGLGDIQCRIAGGPDDPLTLERLNEELRRGVDILYLVCHGALEDGKRPVLYLQTSEGSLRGEALEVDGQELADLMSELQQCPRLVVLASCESAKASETPAADLASRLAEAGVPAIVAMQGKVSMQSIETAMPVFFSKLRKHGQIDRAMAEARNAIRSRRDAWMPALFSRLRTGRIWYVPGFGEDKGDVKRWDGICNSIRRGKFVPVVGPNIAEHVYGNAADIARRLAEKHGFSLAPHDRSDLARVAQYLSVQQGRDFARDQVKHHQHAALIAKHPDKKDDPLALDCILTECMNDENDPLRILTDKDLLPASLFVTAATDLVLSRSLKKAGRNPEVLYSQWRKTKDNHPAPPEYDGVPDPDSPVVFHAFGVRGQVNSLVLTEGDYLDYSISAGKYDLLPIAVSGALVQSSMIFLGFRLDDLAFRTLFRMIMSLDGVAGLDGFAHVGVQVDPEEHSFEDVERAQEYLKEYFVGELRLMDIYWGTAADFLKKLREELAARKTADVEAAPAMEETHEWAHLD